MKRVVFLLGCLACARPEPQEDTSRSFGLPVAGLTTAQEVAAWDAAVRAAFDVGPELVLLAHPRRLPRSAGLGGGDPLPSTLGAALLERGITRGSCDPVRSSDARAPLCPVERSGYVIRGTEVFRGAGDTLRMNLRSEMYAASSGTGQQPFAFEMAYKMVPRPEGGYRVVAEGRVREK
jgi:hypothetical protein